VKERPMKVLCMMSVLLCAFMAVLSGQESGDYYAAGNKLFREGAYEEALEQYTKAIQLDPRNGSYYASGGATYGKLGMYEEGLKELEKAISVEPSLEEPYYLIESFYAELERTDEAIGFLKKKSEGSPKNGVIAVALGYAYYRKGALDEARSEMERAVANDPLYPLAHAGLGVVLLADNKDEEAKQEFEKALELRPDYPEAHLYLGVVYRRAGNEEAAQAEMEAAYALKPKLREVSLTGTLPIRGKSAIPLLSLLPDDFQRSVDIGYRHIKLNLGVGISNIEDENWYALTSHPEIDYSYFGARVSLEFLVNGEGDLRETDMEIEKIMQYVRLGNAGKPFYLMGGKINDFTIGYGSIVQSYMNQSDESNRRIGALIAVNTPFATLNGMLNDVQDPDVFAGRAGFKPLQFLQAGVSAAMDVNQDADNQTEDEGVSIYGGDFTLSFTASDVLLLGVLGDVAMIDGYGTGAMAGVLLMFQGREITSPKLSFFSAYVYNGEEYEPGFFNTFYEKEKRTYALTNTTKALMLPIRYPEPTGGVYTKTALSIPPILDISGTFRTVFDVDSSGSLSLLGAFLPNTNFIARGGYYREGISEMSEAFAFDENTVTGVLVGYWFTRYTAFMLNYEWTYFWDESDSEYKTQQRVTPVLHIATQF
jgi:tetratricopeptide (TPR) repeat protein